MNLYLACAVVNAGTGAIAAYARELVVPLLKIDGKDEFVIYLAAVGKVNYANKAISEDQGVTEWRVQLRKIPGH